MPSVLPFPGWVTGRLPSRIHDLLRWYEIVTYFRSAEIGDEDKPERLPFGVTE